jgi:hypothetical protein
MLNKFSESTRAVSPRSFFGGAIVGAAAMLADSCSSQGRDSAIAERREIRHSLHTVCNSSMRTGGLHCRSVSRKEH